MSLISYFLIFSLGAAVGSFLNCLLYRLTLPNFSLKNLAGLKNRSFCPKCQHQLAFFDLIPVFSFIFLKGKCRYCGEKISFRYPLVEIATGIIFILIFNFYFLIFNKFLIFNFKTISELIYLLAISSSLIVIFVYDLKHYLIPDKIIYPTIAIVFLYRIAASLGFAGWDLLGHRSLVIGILESLQEPLLSGLGASLFFFLIWSLSQGKWLGFGDVKLAFVLGLFLGFPHILVGLFFAFFIGAIIGVGLMAAGKKKLQSPVPFGPFLVAGTFIALFWGEQIARWYVNLL